MVHISKLQTHFTMNDIIFLLLLFQRHANNLLQLDNGVKVPPRLVFIYGLDNLLADCLANRTAAFFWMGATCLFISVVSITLFNQWRCLIEEIWYMDLTRISWVHLTAKQTNWLVVLVWLTFDWLLLTLTVWPWLSIICNCMALTTLTFQMQKQPPLC